jgi:hypothetical protein
LCEGSDGGLFQPGYRQVTFDSADSNQAADDDHYGDLFSNLHEFFFGTNAKDAFSVRPSPVNVAKEGESIAVAGLRQNSGSMAPERPALANQDCPLLYLISIVFLVVSPSR